MKTVAIRRYGDRAYVKLENHRFIRKSGIVAIVDLDRSCYSRVTRNFLSCREKSGRLIVASDGLPRSFVIYDDGLREESYLSALSVETLRARTETETAGSGGSPLNK